MQAQEFKQIKDKVKQGIRVPATTSKADERFLERLFR